MLDRTAGRKLTGRQIDKILASPDTGRQKAPMRMEWLHPSQLFIDRKVLVNPRMPEDRLPKLKKIAAIFSWDKFNPLTVAERSDGKFAILNGGGSFWIVTQILTEFADFLLPCHVVSTTIRTRADESDVFMAQKDGTVLTAGDYFKAALVHRDPEALEIEAQANAIGMKVSAPWPKGFPSIPVVYALHSVGLLARTACICRDVWKKKPPNAAIIAVAIILEAHKKLDEARLRKVLADNDPTPILKTISLQGKGKMHLYHGAGILASRYITLYDERFQGQLLGGVRERKNYYPHDRKELEGAATRIINIWKQPKQKAKGTTKQK